MLSSWNYTSEHIPWNCYFSVRLPGHWLLEMSVSRTFGDFLVSKKYRILFKFLQCFFWPRSFLVFLQCIPLEPDSMVFASPMVEEEKLGREVWGLQKCLSIYRAMFSILASHSLLVYLLLLSMVYWSSPTDELITMIDGYVFEYVTCLNESWLWSFETFNSCLLSLLSLEILCTLISMKGLHVNPRASNVWIWSPCGGSAMWVLGPSCCSFGVIFDPKDLAFGWNDCKLKKE